MDLLQQFKEFIKKENLFQEKDRLLLAVSGGVDSVVLCELCHRAGYDFVIAHCNFQLREEESERDEAFVKTLGEKYGVKVLVKKIDTAEHIKLTKLSVQEAARNLRYSWFRELITNGSLGGRIASTNGWHMTIDYSKPLIHIVTAHHLNDSIETLLMNFFKGTGIKGLQGIKPSAEMPMFIHRPLLFATKQELLTFAKENELPFVEDSSNSTDKYTRNFFRNQLLPSIKKVFPDVENNLADNLHRFSEIEILYEQAIALHKKKLVEKKGNELHIPVQKILRTEPLQTVMYEIIKEFDFSSQQVTEVIALLDSESGKYVQSATHRIIRNRKWLIISPNNSTEAANILIELNDRKIDYPAGSIELKSFPIDNSKLSADTTVAMLDADQISFPLLLRKWKQGDYFYPLGMSKKKKLNRFFTDNKLSLTQKENTWVIEMNKKIIWIVGMRIDDRFKITGQTKTVLKITAKP